jgi:hypothetical protein
LSDDVTDVVKCNEVFCQFIEDNEINLTKKAMGLCMKRYLNRFAGSKTVNGKSDRYYFGIKKNIDVDS